MTADVRVQVQPFDPRDPLIARFQIALFREHGLKFAKLQSINSRRTWDAITSELVRDTNDCYRWLPYRLHDKLHTCAVLVGSEPVHMSFTERYGDWVRVGVNFYTLRAYRTVIRNPLWDRTNGYFNQLMDAHIRGHFVTYYEANPKLAALVRMLRKPTRQSGVFGSGPTWLSEFSIRGNAIDFNGVPQHISFRDNQGADAWQDCMQYLKYHQEDTP